MQEGLGGVAAVVVEWLRSEAAVMVLAIVVGASYPLALLVQLLFWPEWIVRATIFGAMGHPYLGLPPAGEIVFLAGLLVLGGAAAAVIAERSPKIA